MSEKYHALMSNGTWSLVPSSPCHNIVGCKWVFQIKRKPNGSMDRYKARFVAKDYNQKEGVDYSETYSTVIKPTTIRAILTLAPSKGWSL